MAFSKAPLLLLLLSVITAKQLPFFTPEAGQQAVYDHPAYPPRIDYAALEHDDGSTRPPRGMKLFPLHVSGKGQERVELMFFSDGYTASEEKKYLEDAETLTRNIVSESGSMGHVRDLLNIWAVFVPSKTSGVGVDDKPFEQNPFGLYRPGPELRGVYVKHPKTARAACRYWREQGGKGGCDSAILLGNDPLYGGLGGEFTVITASEKNGPLVLRHELGHTLIPVGEEYEGGFAYCGVNAESTSKVENVKWKKFLTDPTDNRIEDMQVRLQDYPWHDLSAAPYSNHFLGSNPVDPSLRSYTTAFLRLSLSSIPHPSHVKLTINEQPLDLSPGFPQSWAGSKDRRWVEILLEEGVPGGEVRIKVELTDEGKREEAGQGGKMITSIEVMEYGTPDRFNRTEGYVGAFPTFSMYGTVTLRPTNEDCLMRRVTQPGFCPVCADGLKKSLERMIRVKNGKGVEEDAKWGCVL